MAPTWIYRPAMDYSPKRRLLAVVPLVTFCVTVPLAAVASASGARDRSVRRLGCRHRGGRARVAVPGALALGP